MSSHVFAERAIKHIWSCDTDNLPQKLLFSF